MHRQAPPPCARIQPPDFRVAQPHSFRSSIAPYSQARSPNSNPYPNRLPGSGASTLPVQVPGAKAFTDPQMTGKHRPMEGQPHSFRSSIAPYSDPNQARSPNSNPYPNKLPGSGASNLPVQVPGAKDPQMTGKHRPMEGQFHASYTATD